MSHLNMEFGTGWMIGFLFGIFLAAALHVFIDLRNGEKRSPLTKEGANIEEKPQ